MNSAALGLVGDRLSLSGIDCLCPIFPLFVALTDSSPPDWGSRAKIDKFNWFTRLGILDGKKLKLFCLGVEKLVFELGFHLI